MSIHLENSANYHQVGRREERTDQLSIRPSSCMLASYSNRCYSTVANLIWPLVGLGPSILNFLYNDSLIVADRVICGTLHSILALDWRSLEKAVAMLARNQFKSTNVRLFKLIYLFSLFTIIENHPSSYTLSHLRFKVFHSKLKCHLFKIWYSDSPVFPLSS